MGALERKPRLEIVRIDTLANIADCTEINIGDASSVAIQLPASAGTTLIHVYAKIGENAYGLATDEDGGDITLNPAALIPRPIKSAVFAYDKIKLVAGGGVATAAVPVIIKS